MFLISLPVTANESAPVPIDPLSTESLIRVFGSLGLILVAIFALVWLLRRSGKLVRGRGGKMQIIDVLPLGQRERLVLVSLGDQQILLGVAPGRVQAVHCIDAPIADTADAASGGKFAEVLRQTYSGENIQAKKGGNDE